MRTASVGKASDQRSSCREIAPPAPPKSALPLSATTYIAISTVPTDKVTTLYRDYLTSARFRKRTLAFGFGRHEVMNHIFAGRTPSTSSFT